MSEPIRILHILQRMEAGGTQTLLMNLYRKIDRKKVQFDFLVVYTEEQFYDEEIKELGGKIYKLSFREDFNLLKFKRDLNCFFQNHHEYKIVHCHAYTIGYFCLREAMLANIPVRIAHSHNNETVHDFKYIPKLFMQKIFTKYATHLFACSEEAGKYLFKNKPFQILKNAINSELFIADNSIRNNIRSELRLSEKFVVGHVGRLHPQKNHDFLIEVFKQIKAYNDKAMLILIGSGPLEKKIREKVNQNNLNDSVLFLGNRKDMNKIYQAMDVFIFPSLFEGLGIVTIEAQASGIPVICSDGVPIDTKVTPLYKKLSLTDSKEKWAENALNIAENPLCHTNMQQFIIDTGYDMKSTVNFIEKFYLEMYFKVKGGLL